MNSTRSSDTSAIVPQAQRAMAPAGVEAKQGFSERSITRAAETASSAVAAQARAAVEARFVMAMQNPRDWMVVRDKLIQACRRPGFAQRAIYAKPVGKEKIKGESIRFAEEAARCMGNLDVASPVIFDDDEKQLVRVIVTDIESNTAYSEDVLVEKTVERRQLREGQHALATRTNSYGDLVYIVEATDDEMLVKRNALKSKAIRNCILRVLPSDIREDARAEAEVTMSDRAAKDPDGERKWIADAMRNLGVTPEHLREYLGKPLGEALPEELVELREIGQAINDRETTWGEVMAKKNEPTEGKPAPSKARQELGEKLNQRKPGQAAAAAPVPVGKAAAETRARSPEVATADAPPEDFK